VFVDQILVHLRSGDGGAGVASFKRQRGKPRGRAEGGSGGNGGDVVVFASDRIGTLLDYKRRPHRGAKNGTHGSGDLRHGRAGEDEVLAVPVGTIVRDPDGTVIADLAQPDQRVTLVTGGRGGKGNSALVSRANVAPNFAEQGEYGESRDFVLELKLLADAALIGYPNAGKSTFISRVSAAKPKIADYPFTTLEPNLGVVEVDDRRFVLADIPGLIEGAAEGKGLGHAFLRHAERARALVVLLDPSPLQEADCLEQLQVLRAELEAHDPALAARAEIVAVSKFDLGQVDSTVEQLRVAGVAPYVVSAVTGDGVEELLHAIADAVDRAERDAPPDEGFQLHRPVPPTFAIERQGKRWVVSGRLAERAVALDDLTKPEAADHAARRLASAGVDTALREAGAMPGDEVQIGEIVFEFSDDF
jgi:GTP-binding protein